VKLKEATRVMMKADASAAKPAAPAADKPK
jgi:hypothetical protein